MTPYVEAGSSCPTCNGRGRVVRYADGGRSMKEEECVYCNGLGRILPERSGFSPRLDRLIARWEAARREERTLDRPAAAAKELEDTLIWAACAGAKGLGGDIVAARAIYRAMEARLEAARARTRVVEEPLGRALYLGGWHVPPLSTWKYLGWQEGGPGGIHRVARESLEVAPDGSHAACDVRNGTIVEDYEEVD